MKFGTYCINICNCNKTLFNIFILVLQFIGTYRYMNLILIYIHSYNKLYLTELCSESFFDVFRM